jgi:hypothetical protein
VARDGAVLMMALAEWHREAMAEQHAALYKMGMKQ